ncbi:MAG: PHP domain-containing protein [Propioniciclava sp.]|uniref:PHP domain-containing protein n=1 Tax=Propioniciclava sp. TaxID=2038686 RepID=UPI0039E28B97
MRIDLHTHSLVSDGTDAPAQLVRNAASAGLDVIALTDHDTFDGIDEAKAAAQASGIGLLAGLEFSTQRAGASVHLLAYGCDPSEPALRDELAKVREGRNGRVPGMVARLTELGMPITIEDVFAQAGGSSLGRPHIADALVAKGYLPSRDAAFRDWLYEGGPAYVDRYCTELTRAIALVRQAYGVAVLAHPWARGRRDDLPEEFLADLVAHGLDGIEVDHPDHDADTREALRGIAGRLGLLATGSSDHHGLGKVNNPLGACLTDPEVYAEIVRRIHARGGCA